VAEGGGLLNRYRLVKAYRGFESLCLRQQNLNSDGGGALTSDVYAMQPTPARIQHELNRSPALARDEVVASTYLGKRVYWRTRFFNAMDTDHGPLKLFSFTQRGLHRWSRLDPLIYADIDIDRSPETRTMRQGRRVDLYGAIVKVDPVLGITLALDQFQILPITLVDRFVQAQDSRL
jgi:hypothetical protein